MANQNCLQGMKCPECGSEEPFTISAHCWVDMTDEGSDEVRDLEWDNDSTCVCGACGHAALVGDFMETE